MRPSEHDLYVTPQEASELGTEIFRLVRRYDARVDHPERRPPGAVPFEVVVPGRQVPDLAGAAHGLPGPGQAG